MTLQEALRESHEARLEFPQSGAITWPPIDAFSGARYERSDGKIFQIMYLDREIEGLPREPGYILTIMAMKSLPMIAMKSLHLFEEARISFETFEEVKLALLFEHLVNVDDGWVPDVKNGAMKYHPKLPS